MTGKIYNFEKELVGKNIHGVFVYCFDCFTYGNNFPLDMICGNCNSLNTTTYYDSETIDKYLMLPKGG